MSPEWDNDLHHGFTSPFNAGTLYFMTVLEDLALLKLTVRESRGTSKLTAGDWIYLLRNRLRMTQAELAQRAHITRQTSPRLSLGKLPPK